MRLLTRRDCALGRLVQVAAQERSIPIDLEWVGDHGRLDHLSPLGRTPVLVTDQGDALHDLAAILEYLDAKHEGTPLVPAEQRWLALDRVALCRELIDIISRRSEELHRPSSMQSRAVIEVLDATIWRTLEWLDEHVVTFSPPAGALSADQIALACALDYTDFSYSLHWHLTFSRASRWLIEARRCAGIAETKLVRQASAGAGP